MTVIFDSSWDRRVIFHTRAWDRKVIFYTRAWDRTVIGFKFNFSLPGLPLLCRNLFKSWGIKSAEVLQLNSLGTLGKILFYSGLGLSFVTVINSDLWRLEKSISRRPDQILGPIIKQTDFLTTEPLLSSQYTDL